MLGTISQIPPAFSAVHVNGERAYALARRGEYVNLHPKDVVIQSIEVLHYEWPRLELRIECGSGTYIRSIARDLGNSLGTGGLMSRLERTRVGNFEIRNAIDVELLTNENIAEHICPAIRIVENLPMLDCTSDDVASMLCGRSLPCEADRFRGGAVDESDVRVALTSNQFRELLALAERGTDGRLQPRTVFVRG